MSNSGPDSPVISAIALFWAVAAICAAVVGVAYADLLCLGNLHTQSETSLVEIVQATILAGISLSCFIAAARRPSFRGGFILAGGFFLSMFIRENDWWLDAIHRGVWFSLILATVAACLFAAWHCRASVRDGLHVLCAPQTVLLGAVSMALLLVFSRLFGCKAFWSAAGIYQSAHAVKTVVEETLELLSYAFLALWAFLAFHRLPRKP